MHPPAKKNIGALIRMARTAKGYTQQELSDLTGISLRSVQRIENEEVSPRAYTIRVLVEKLEIGETLIEETGETPDLVEQDTIAGNGAAATVVQENAAGVLPPRGLNTSRKIILSVGTALLLVMGTAAYIFQSHSFPETAFEATLLWMAVTFIYLLILLRVWK